MPRIGPHVVGRLGENPGSRNRDESGGKIADGVYPSFADCGLNSRPDAELLEMVKWRLVKEPFSGNPSLPLTGSGLLYQTLTGLVARQEAEATDAPKKSALPLRSWFEDSGVCVFRPAQPGGMAVAFKGGHNAEHHNHNDVGTTVVVWKGQPVLADPGAMVYRAETFSKDRYRLPIMGSFGHSVPVVAGFLQADGAKCRGKVLDTEFSLKHDRVTKINNPGKPAAIRLGLTLTELAADGGISMDIRPLPEGDKAPRAKLPVVEAPEKLADARKTP